MWVRFQATAGQKNPTAKNLTSSDPSFFVLVEKFTGPILSLDTLHAAAKLVASLQRADL